MNKAMEDAIWFIDEELKSNPGANRTKLIEKACQEFDLEPNQEEFLINKFVLNDK